MPVVEYVTRPGDGMPIRLAAPELPRQPDLSEGRCCAPGVDPDLWSSHVPAERQAAISMCRNCPVREPCASWAASIPPTSTTLIFGGMTTAERIRAHQERAQAAAAQAARLAAPWGHAAVNAAKTRCDQGHELAGGNLMITTRPDGRTKRVCRTCHRAQVARAARLARQVQPGAISEARRARYRRSRDQVLARQRAAYARRKREQATSAAA